MPSCDSRLRRSWESAFGLLRFGTLRVPHKNPPYDRCSSCQPAQEMNDDFDDWWRELGFYCHHDTKNREYRLIGSRSGLSKFPDLLRAYVADPRNEMAFEHEHYGPYGLEVMTSSKGGMDDHAIHGPLPKLAELALIIEAKLNRAVAGDGFQFGKSLLPTPSSL